MATQINVMVLVKYDRDTFSLSHYCRHANHFEWIIMFNIVFPYHFFDENNQLLLAHQISTPKSKTIVNLNIKWMINVGSPIMSSLACVLREVRILPLYHWVNPPAGQPSNRNSHRKSRCKNSEPVGTCQIQWVKFIKPCLFDRVLRVGLRLIHSKLKIRLIGQDDVKKKNLCASSILHGSKLIENLLF